MPISVKWSRKDYSRIPYWLYHDTDIYKEEQELIFRGATWAYLCFEAEIPNPGDYKTTWVGDTPILVNRDRSGDIHAMVNRCSHRGAAVYTQSSSRQQPRLERKTDMNPEEENQSLVAG